MYDLALIVGMLFLVVLVSGPLSVWLAVRHYSLASLFMAAVALMFGINWFVAVSTTIRFVGLATAVLGITAIWYSVRFMR